MELSSALQQFYELTHKWIQMDIKFDDLRAHKLTITLVPKSPHLIGLKIGQSESQIWTTVFFTDYGELLSSKINQTYPPYLRYRSMT